MLLGAVTKWYFCFLPWVKVFVFLCRARNCKKWSSLNFSECHSLLPLYFTWLETISFDFLPLRISLVFLLTLHIERTGISWLAGARKIYIIKVKGLNKLLFIWLGIGIPSFSRFYRYLECEIRCQRVNSVAQKLLISTLGIFTHFVIIYNTYLPCIGNYAHWCLLY